MNRFDTSDWHLGCFMEWRPKKAPYSIQCPSCLGEGVIGGHFKDLDGPRVCDHCYGAKQIVLPGPRTPKPELPKELVEHMRKAWQEFVQLPLEPVKEEPKVEYDYQPCCYCGGAHPFRHKRNCKYGNAHADGWTWSGGAKWEPKIKPKPGIPEFVQDSYIVPQQGPTPGSGALTPENET